MFDNNTGGLIKLLYAFKRGIGVGNIIKRQFFTLQLHCRCNAGFGRIGFGIKSRFLMGVFAVTHFLRLKILDIEGIRKITFFIVSISGAKVISDHSVISGGMFEGFYH